MEVNPPLAVVCLSLGGTKLQLGALKKDGSFLSGSAIHWRSKPNYQSCLAAKEADKFCSLLVQEVANFVQVHGFELEDVETLGIPFPGPEHQGRWYSNNLTAAFRKGVDLQGIMSKAVAGIAHGRGAPEIRVVFDAQCDAGGELYHPRGKLYGDPSPTATVLNIATGITAGYIANGKVLVEEEDFRLQISPKYDAGSGQLGRHLWYFPESGTWQYCYLKEGGTPLIDGIRLTERLSGPALAGRLVSWLSSRGLLNRELWSGSIIAWSVIAKLLDEVKDVQNDDDLANFAQYLRSASQPVAGALLQWADQIHSESGDFGSEVDNVVENFGSEVAEELAGAIKAWMSAPGWARYGRRIVLTGGVGIHFLSADNQNGFLNRLQRSLPKSCRVERSSLDHSTERECYLFLHQKL